MKKGERMFFKIIILCIFSSSLLSLANESRDELDYKFYKKLSMAETIKKKRKECLDLKSSPSENLSKEEKLELKKKIYLLCKKEDEK